MRKISKYITYKEAIKSQTASRLGIENQPDDQQLAAMQFVGSQIFDKVREFVGGILFVSSFFRSYQLNAAIGGSVNSQHCEGEAIDIDADVYNSNGVSNADIFHFIKENLEFDQLIWEFGDDQNPDWVHVSATASGNRKQMLRASRIDGKVHYQNMI